MSTNTLRSLVVTGLFAIPFVPLIVSKSLLFPFITGKAFVFRIIVEIIFALWLVLIIKASEYRPKFSWISVAIIGFIVAIGLADLFAVNSTKAFWSNFERMEGFLGLLHFGMYFFVLSSVIKTKNLWNNLFATSLFVSGIMALYSFLQLAGKIVINQGGVRVDGTFGNATYLAIYIVFHIFIALYLSLNVRNLFAKYALGASILANLIVLYFTATRGAILGLIGGAIITFIFFLLKSEKGDRIRKISLFSIVGIVAFIGVFFTLRNTSYVANSPVLSRFSTLSVSEIKTQGRYYVWPIAWKGFLERPILGWGQEGFNFVFNKYYNPSMYNQEPWFDRTHNIVLDWLIAGGVVGFLAYISILGAFFVTLFKKSSFTFREKAILFGMVAAYCFHNLFVFDQIGSYILFFSILAFVHANSSTESPEWVKKIGNKFRIFETEGIAPIVSSLIVIAILSSLYFWNLQPWQENKNIIKVLTLASQGKTSSLEEYKKPLIYGGLGFPEALEHLSNAVLQALRNPSLDQKTKEDLVNITNEAFKRQMEIAPTDARYRLFYGFFLSNLGDVDGAIEQYNEAAKYAPNKQQILFELGSTLLSKGNKEEALATFKKAYGLEPSYDEAKYIYGLAALSVGDRALSGSLLKDFDKDKILFDDRYVSVLASIGRYNEVISIIKERIEREPTNMQYRLSLAAAYLQSGERQMAIGVIREMIVIDPSFKERGEYYITEIQTGRNP